MLTDLEKKTEERKETNNSECWQRQKQIQAFMPSFHYDVAFFRWDGVAMVTESNGSGAAASWLAGRDLLNAV